MKKLIAKAVGFFHDLITFKMMKKLLVLVVLMLALGALAWCVWFPLHNSYVKLGTIMSIGMIWLCVALFLWRMRVVFGAWCLLPVLMVAALFAPHEKIDAQEIKNSYLKHLKSFEGVPYFWGGENHQGIDCSGLPRKSLRNAYLDYAVRHFNSLALREYVRHWWYDSTAKALGKGYRNYAVALKVAGKIPNIETATLSAGDFAVTDNGKHLVVYLGDDQWIQAEPNIAKVITLPKNSLKSEWFKQPISMHRWKVLN